MAHYFGNKVKEQRSLNRRVLALVLKSLLGIAAIMFIVACVYLILLGFFVAINYYI